ncbi:MAG: class I SAM-dependent methyltransferase [Ignavibacteriales bacterium]|nr:class I SAM-dependent methyltransferase [Ignavibacteriales bacterium]
MEWALVGSLPMHLTTGADIYGIDISEPMIDVLFGKLDKKEHHRISIQSITDFHFDFTFDLIIGSVQGYDACAR